VPRGGRHAATFPRTGPPRKGSVEIHPLEACADPGSDQCGYTHLRYEFRGGGVTSKGVLTMISGDKLDRVFEQAGVDWGA
jgi:hypothetical protein